MSVTPEQQAPTVEAPVTAAMIEDYNRQVSEQIGIEPPVDDTITPVATPAPVEPPAEPATPAPPVVEEPVVDEPADTEDLTEDKASEDAEEDDAEGEKPADTELELSFKLGADVPLDEFQEQKAEYLKTVEITPELRAILDRNDAELAKKDEILGEIDGIANKDTLLKLGSAMNSLFDTDEDGAVNPKPLVELLRNDFKNEYRPIATEILASDSMKYEGASILEELLIDTFGAEKATKMVQFGQTDIPLPVIPATLQLPAGIDDKNKEAYWKLPEVKRFEITSLASEIKELQDDLKDASEFRREEIAREVNEKKEKLDAEIYAVEQIQKSYDGDRNAVATRERQQFEAAVRFRSEVNTDYNTELFTLADTFANDLAPRLSYADTDTQLSQARNILSRVNNALGFMVNDDGSFAEDPMAEFYAKQLSEEGVKFDFSKGRDLLKSHYKAVEKLKALHSRQNVSPQAVEIATKAKNKIMLDIKTEERQLLGQLSTKYVTSNGTAVGKQIQAVKDKKQAVKAITDGKPHVSRGPDSPDKLAKDLEAYNRKVAASTGEELFDQHAA